MLKRTRRTVTAAELRRVLGLSRLTGTVIACAGGEWRQDGARWRFWRETSADERPAAPAASESATERWWDR